MNEKIYVNMVAEMTKEGKIYPSKIIWEDGRIFAIDKITDIKKMASLKAGGYGVRYTCNICGKQCNIYLEEDKWFIEKVNN